MALHFLLRLRKHLSTHRSCASGFHDRFCAYRFSGSDRLPRCATKRHQVPVRGHLPLDHASLDGHRHIGVHVHCAVLRAEGPLRADIQQNTQLRAGSFGVFVVPACDVLCFNSKFL